MNISRLILVAAVGVFALSACGKTESLAQTQQDVAGASSAGAKDVAEEQYKAASITSDANADVAAANRKATGEITEADADVALVKAKADYKVSVEQCEAQTGAARDACKSTAKSVLDVAQARVDARKT